MRLTIAPVVTLGYTPRHKQQCHRHTSSSVTATPAGTPHWGREAGDEASGTMVANGRQNVVPDTTQHNTTGLSVAVAHVMGGCGLYHCAVELKSASSRDTPSLGS